MGPFLFSANHIQLAWITLVLESLVLFSVCIKPRYKVVPTLVRVVSPYSQCWGHTTLFSGCKASVFSCITCWGQGHHNFM